IIAARLVTLAGSVEDLARAPAGTVQLLGAERALFRHLRTGSRPPKHGVLFQHPLVHRAPTWQRGAIARALAGRIAMAARADAYTKRRIAPDLLRSLDSAVIEIRRRKSERPARTTGHRTRNKRRSKKGRRQQANFLRTRHYRCRRIAMSWEQAEIRELKVNRYVVIDDEPCRSISIETSKLGN